MSRKRRILFLCTGNACRSQMAEGWARQLPADRIEAYSAGVAPKPLDPRAVEVMREAGVDISSQSPKHVEALLDLPFDLVVTLCDGAAESCPAFPGSARRIHQGFRDPPMLAASARSEDEALAHYRGVRDEIRDFVASLAQRCKD